MIQTLLVKFELLGELEGVRCDLSFRAVEPVLPSESEPEDMTSGSGDDCSSAAAWTAQRLAEYPGCLAPLMLFLKGALKQAELGEPAKGGLGGYSLANLLVAHLRNSAPEVYPTSNPWPLRHCQLHPGTPAARRLQDPTLLSNDLGKATHKWDKVQKHFIDIMTKLNGGNPQPRFPPGIHAEGSQNVPTDSEASAEASSGRDQGNDDQGRQGGRQQIDRLKHVMKFNADGLPEISEPPLTGNFKFAPGFRDIGRERAFGLALPNSDFDIQVQVQRSQTINDKGHECKKK
eukprot:gene13327-15746_t